jgi:hypothetical protein
MMLACKFDEGKLGEARPALSLRQAPLIMTRP